ncbi:MAG: hypothetical protein K0R62_5321 [Nonomuraea muscovyensis]|nr:hypothetical protein [Nonomuraea muscovyensis]
MVGYLVGRVVWLSLTALSGMAFVAVAGLFMVLAGGLTAIAGRPGCCSPRPSCAARPGASPARPYRAVVKRHSSASADTMSPDE